MRKIYLTLSALILAGGSLFAQAKLDLGSQTFMRGKACLEAPSKHKSATVTTANTHSVIIRLAEGQTTDELEAAGVVITNEIGGKYVTASVTREQLGKIEGMRSVAAVSSSRKLHLHNDKARSSSNIDAIHAGTNLAQAYKGDGVIVAVVDGGFNPNHVAFMKDDCTTSRVQKFVYYNVDDNTGEIKSVDEYTGSDLASYTTDDNTETHGTHTAGIAAGGTAGGQAAYYGMAPNADIIMYAGSLTSEMILKSAVDAQAYAAKVGKPLVISMSLGDNYGPHDGTDDFTAALNEVAKDVPVCLSAGNEADLNIVVNKTFTSSDLIAKTAIVPSYDLSYSYPKYQGVGDVVVYSDDDTDFKVQFAIVNKSTGGILYSYTLTEQVNYLSSGNVAEAGDLSDTNFTKYFPNSYIGMVKGLDTNNNRMCAQFSFQLINNTYSSSATVLPAIIVTGKAGQTVRMYSDGFYSEFTTNSGFDKPTQDGTISNMACGKHTISVGAYNSKSIAPYSFSSSELGEIAYFSSYGKLADGRVLPAICAPGCALVSAMNYYYTRNSSYYDSTYTPKTATVKIGTKSHYYTPMQGTSMSCPAMSGTVALWLQANPNLSPAEIEQIAKSTAVAPDNYSLEWGAAGKLDGYAGLKKALEFSGVTEVEADGNATVLVKEIAEHQFEVFAVDAKVLNVALYNMAGQQVATAVAQGDTATLDASNANAGVYVLKVSGGNVNHARKIVLK